LWPAVDRVCRRRRAIFLKVEPDAWEPLLPGVETVALAGFQPSPHAVQPLRTVTVSLAGDEDSILARMKQKTRYNIRLAEKKEVRVRAWDDLAGFHQLMQETGARDVFGVHSLDYYRRVYAAFYPREECELLVAEYAGQPLAALFVFARGARAWYLYGASGDRERSRMPAYLLQWEAMRWARRRGCLEYDLWGVPDEDEDILEAQFETRQDGLWGVYRFKRGFGGTLRRSAAARDRVYQPLLYRAYRWWLRRRGMEG
jgi:lipid II:glycine glycyltransferase (peptidoglycan interpeptide bridge formation enzyme)